MVFYKFENGTLADANEVNNNLSIISKHALISRINDNLISGDTINDDGFVSGSFEALSEIESGSSTCYYDSQGWVAFCDVLDLFDDASFDNNIWGSSESGMGEVVESSNRLNVRITDQGNNVSGTASVISNQGSGLNLDGQNAEIILSWRRYFSWGDNNNESSSGTQSLQISNGTTHVDLITSSYGPDNNPSNNYDITQSLRIKYDDSTENVYVSINDEGYGSPISVSSISNKYLRFYATQSGNADSTQSGVNVYGVGYRLDGASAGSSILETTTKIGKSNGSSGITYIQSEPLLSGNAYISFDNGATFSNDDVLNKIGEGVNLGSSIKVKYVIDKPTNISSTGSEIPISKKWGALYD